VNNYTIILRLISGEDVIAIAIDDSNGSFVEVEHPFIVAYNPTDGTAILKPYQLWSDDHTFIFNNSSIISVSTANDEISTYYMEVMDSYSKYISAKPTVDDLQELIDKLGLNSTLDDESNGTSIKMEGNTTKH
jgi:hypothetical protein